MEEDSFHGMYSSSKSSNVPLAKTGLLKRESIFGCTVAQLAKLSQS